MTEFEEAEAEVAAVRDEVVPAAADADDDAPATGQHDAITRKRRILLRSISWRRVVAFGVLPVLAMLLAAGAGYLKWMDTTVRDAQVARTESVRAATDSTIAMLSYKSDTVEKDLGAARDRLAGEFKNSYAALTNDVVIPGSKQEQISAMANVPAAASVSANANHAVVLVFVNQTVTIGNDPPTSTASSVRVTLDRIDGRWLISQFDPI